MKFVDLLPFRASRQAPTATRIPTLSLDAELHVQLIAFDAARLAGNALSDRIVSRFPGCWRQLPGAYIVLTPLSSREVRDVLKPALAENDELLVVTLQRQSWTWCGVTDAGVAWLRQCA